MHNFKNSPTKKREGFVMSRCSDISGVQGTYPFYADAYRKAAADLGVLPRELQSVTWEAVRGLYKATAKGLRPEIENIWRQHQLGRISADDARQQILKLTNGIKPPEWAERGRGGSPAEALQGAGDEEELPRSCVSGKSPKQLSAEEEAELPEKYHQRRSAPAASITTPTPAAPGPSTAAIHAASRTRGCQSGEG